MSASKMFKTLCGDLLRLSKKSSNFANTVHAERQSYNNLIRQQSVLLDEYEDLIKAYDEELLKAAADGSVINPDTDTSATSRPSEDTSKDSRDNC
tara:strand:- start:1091 stop:1375 length:285 start_codon:yes stop_codon:yes gene_type:complete